MSEKIRVELEIPLNRVEGDLDIRVIIEDGVIVDAKSIGTLYRGFENILKGRHALDSLVITPRVCGICSITHLNAAVEALEDAQKITPPAQAVRLRNLSLISETIQSDMRQFFLMFMGDFANDFYQDASFYDEAKEYYEAFVGKATKEALKNTTDILRVVAIIGGQWPHTSHMVPGGISTTPSILELALVQNHIEKFILWYEENILLSSLDDFKDTILTAQAFVEHFTHHRDSHIGRFYAYSKESSLFDIGFSYPNFLSYGVLQNPDNPKQRLVKAGVILDGVHHALDTGNIAEDISHGHYKQKNLVQKPRDGVTEPDMSNKKAYTWGKAPRYDENVMQTGPLAQLLVDKDPLMSDLYKEYKDCAFVRELARVLRPLKYLHFARQEIEDAISNFGQSSYEEPEKLFSGEGIGLIEAARGSLGHWINIKDSKIENYQIVTPTAWNGSPRDSKENLGAWEKALIGIKCRDVENPMEMGHVIRSFDPCLVCTVHAVDMSNKKRKYSYKIG
ncbi:MAG: nickel-dependent hydrogenase large subunit [Sulfurimonas sp.]|nr:nickel-dependent hydrogenase large subunit [Sulfurimonas sp.]MDQ7061403.1 nickel-dependent hydrogenase large subunit [Sulfurimonas sp.]